MKNECVLFIYEYPFFVKELNFKKTHSCGIMRDKSPIHEYVLVFYSCHFSVASNIHFDIKNCFQAPELLASIRVYSRLCLKEFKNKRKKPLMNANTRELKPKDGEYYLLSLFW